MKPRQILALILVPMGLIMAAIPQNTTHPYKLSPEKLLEHINSGMQYFSPDEVADMIINEDPSLLLIDVRGADEFEKFHLPGAINIPLASLLDEQWKEYLNQDTRLNVFYSNGTVNANQAWMLTRQLGYSNNYVLQGGLNYWVETIMDPTAPPSTSPSEEVARYDFRKGAGMALGGGSAVETGQSQPAPDLPKVAPRPQKKRVQGGC
ncbi:MAG: rhodanese-like domain-containing protein [Bacteroidetes bacterium]|nr:MAG: rhodanese-like domain-containing protein [Bacteroidota bacterium]